MVGFAGFAVAVILRNIFKKKAVGGCDILTLPKGDDIPEADQAKYLHVPVVKE